MDNLVRVYENVLDKDTCIKLIEKFEAHTEHQEKMQDNKMSFTQIDFRKNMSGWKIEMANLIDICFPYITKYKEEFDPIWPERHAFESYQCQTRDRKDVNVSSNVDTPTQWRETHKETKIYRGKLPTLYIVLDKLL